MIDSEWPRRSIVVLAAMVAWLLPQQEVLAWGANGHRMISQLAIANLPAEVPAFLRTPKVAELLGELAREPDRSKVTGNNHDRDLDRGHYINLAGNFAAADEVPIDPLQATRVCAAQNLPTDFLRAASDECGVNSAMCPEMARPSPAPPCLRVVKSSASVIARRRCSSLHHAIDGVYYFPDMGAAIVRSKPFIQLPSL